MQTHELKPKTKRKDKKRVGRGGNHGKTSGRGTKGQKARAGRKLRPELRDIIKKLPKRRGYKFASIAPKPVAINLSDLNENFTDGMEVSPKILLDKGLISRRGGKVPAVKILSGGELKVKNLIFTNCLFSAGAKTEAEKAGAKIG